jgi:phosphoribosylanthranilate isomerase
MTKIKVCGITEERDAIEAVLLGVDAIGFVFWKPSPRYITPREAGRIAAKLPPFVTRVGVFVDEVPAAVMDAVYAAGLTALQLHGDEKPEECRRYTLSWYKAFRAGPGFDPDVLATYACTTYLLDGSAGEMRGGSGMSADWGAARAARSFGNVILAGGLRPDNVRDAIATVRPYAVDVSSGVEVVPGKKDIDKLEAFVTRVREADERIRIAEEGS